MPRPKPVHGAKPEAPGKRKVMVYVPPGLHRAVKMVALDEGSSASDVYASAVEAFLTARGIELAAEPAVAPLAVDPLATRDDLDGFINSLGDRIEAALDRAVERALLPPVGDTAALVGLKTANAMTAALRMLREAGSDGIGSVELDRALHTARIRSGTAEQAKAILRDAGLARYEKRRWYSAGG